MTALREFITIRRADIKAQIKALRAELSELDIAERSLPDFRKEESSHRTNDAKSAEQKTLKQMAISVLFDHPEGLKSRTLLEKIRERFGVVIQRESLSPQLSRLGAENIIFRDGPLWRLTQQHEVFSKETTQKNETPDAGTSSASELDELFG